MESTTRPYGANQRQVGGGHYQARTQCWDFCIDNNVNPLTFNIISYLTRWERKGNIEDLDKAQHYMDKMRELIIEGRLVPTGGPGKHNVTMTAPEILRRRGITDLADRPLPMPPAGRATPVRDMINELQPEKTPAEERLAHEQGVKVEKGRVEEENRRAAGSHI